MDLYKFLKKNGFKVQDREELSSRFYDNYALLVSPPNDKNLTIGTLYKTSLDPVEHGEIEIIYWLNAAQVEEVIKLRELLVKNNIQYTEQGDKKSIASKFREDAERLNSLADRIEKN